MSQQRSSKIIKKKQYERSKWDDFNKVKVTFVLKQFNRNISKYIQRVEMFGFDPQAVVTSPLTKWFLSLPKTQGRSQEIIRLAFVHNYGYTLGKGTQIGSFKNNNNPFFTQFLKMEQDPAIGIDKINLERQKHRQILRFTSDKVIEDYIAKTNQRKPSKRARFTKKDIKEEEKEQFVLQLQKFFNQLIREPTKEEIAQEYEDPEEYDEVEKEYFSENQFEFQDDETEALQKKEKHRDRSQIVLEELEIISIKNYEKEEYLCYVPSPIQSQKSFSLSLFDQGLALSQVQSEDESEKLDEEIPNILRQSYSEEQEKMMVKKMSSISLCFTEQQFEDYQKKMAFKYREQDLNDWI